MAKPLALPHYYQEVTRPDKTPPPPMLMGGWLFEHVGTGFEAVDSRYFDQAWVEGAQLPSFLRKMFGERNQEITKPNYLKLLPFIQAAGPLKYALFTKNVDNFYMPFEGFKLVCEYLMLADAALRSALVPEDVVRNPTHYVQWAMKRRYLLIRKEHEFAKAVATSPAIYGCPA